MSEAGHTKRLEAALDGRYRIERKLGEGGMASVYLAEDIKHRRNVALKILRPELAAVLGSERFLAEIQTTANLQHPHILPLFDSGEADGYLYYVMPYIDGETLREKLDREKQLGVEEAVRIARDVADALDYAHRAGVIHRDIKPGNILLHDGRPVVADFGIALAVSAAGGGRMTETGLSLGTPHYMSPEQASADRDLSPKSDVYSLGCVLYEMLAGQPPHTGPSAQSILVHILTEEPKPLTALRHTVPPHISATVAKSIEKLPADRFESAKNFREALGDEAFSYVARRKPATQAIPPESSSHHARPGRSWKVATVAATSLAAVLAVILGLVLAGPGPSPRSPVVQVLSTDGWAGLDRPIGRVAALAPDGSSMILPLGDGTLGLKLAASTEIVAIPGTEAARDVVYAPDGQSILYVVGTEIFRRPIGGGPAVRLLEDTEGGDQRVAMAWFDDGTVLLEGSNGQLLHLPENGGAPFGTVDELGGLYWMEALPGGRGALAVAAGPDLHVVDLGDYSTAPLLEDVWRAWYAPTEHLVYVRTDGAVFAQPFDLDGLELSGGPIPLFEGVRVSITHADMRLAADGGLLYVEGQLTAGGANEAVVAYLDGSREHLPLSPRLMSALNWSPDGETVAFGSQGQIYTYNTVLNTTPRQITFEGNSFAPVFSPDGTQLVFSTLPVQPTGTGTDLFVKELLGDVPPTLLASLDGVQMPVEWPVDSLLTFLQGPSNAGPFDLWTLDLSDTEAPEARPYLTSEAMLAPMSISPDGTLAAYGSNEAGDFEVHVRAFPDPGERTVVAREGARGAWWSPDGTALYYSAGYTADRTVTMVAAQLRRDPFLTVLSTDTLFVVENVNGLGSSALHPDGDRFVFSVAAQGGEGAAAREARLVWVQNWFDELRTRVGEN